MRRKVLFSRAELGRLSNAHGEHPLLSRAPRLPIASFEAAAAEPGSELALGKRFAARPEGCLLAGGTWPRLARSRPRHTIHVACMT